MTVEEAMKTAIEYEIRVREVYVEALEGATDPVAKKVYKLMADEEDDHVKYLEHKLEQLKKSGELSADDLETAVPAPGQLEKEISKLVEKVGQEPRTDELAVLRKAYDVEKETSAFYAGLVETLPDDGKAFFQRFLEIEAGHIALVQAEIDALEGNGMWFDLYEFDVEAG